MVAPVLLVPFFLTGALAQETIEFWAWDTVLEWEVEAVAATSADPAAPPPKVAKALLEKRLEAARSVYKENLARVQNGVGLPPDLFGWSARWLEAEMALADNQAARIKALRDHLDRTRQVERMAVEAANSGQGRKADADAAIYYRLEAEIRLQKEGVEPQPVKQDKGKPEKKKGPG
jgi:hypothetical protein